MAAAFAAVINAYAHKCTYKYLDWWKSKWYLWCNTNGFDVCLHDGIKPYVIKIVQVHSTMLMNIVWMTLLIKHFLLLGLQRGKPIQGGFYSCSIQFEIVHSK